MHHACDTVQAEMHSMHDMPRILKVQAAAVKLQQQQQQQQCHITPSLSTDHDSDTRHKLKPTEHRTLEKNAAK